MDIYSIVKDAYNKNYGNAALTAGMMLFPFDKFLKPVGKGIKKLFTKFIKSSKDINAKNLQNITNAEWDKLYNKAIKNNDLEEAQKLRDLHFKQKTPNNKVINKQYHVVGDNYDSNFTIFDPKENHTSIYTTDNMDMASSYSKYWLSNEEKLKSLNNLREKDISYKNKIIKDLQEELDYRQNNNKSNNYKYENTESLKARLDIELKDLELLNDDNNFQNYYNFYNTTPQPNRVKKLNIYLKNPIQIDNGGNNWNDIRISNLPKDVYDNIKVDRRSNFLDSRYSTLSLENVSKDLGYDGVIIDNVTDYGKHWGDKYINFNIPNQVVITNDKNKLKLADAITYDDNGNIIPLSKRDNFNNPDMRYNWLLPTIGVGTGLSLINNNEDNQYKYGGKMNRQKAPFGILKNLGEIFGFSKKDDKPKETSKTKKTNKPISKIYIGGKPNEARQKYYDLDTEFADSVKAVSKRYGLNPNLVASRLAKEGPVDHNIKLSNDGYRFIRDVVFGPQWGLDDLGNHIKEGKVNIKESWNNIDVDDSFVNEKGRLTNTVYSPNWVDGIYGTAAELKYRRDYMKKHFPKMTEEQLDAAAAASFNRGNAGARKWINRGGNYMQYRPFIKLKQLGGKANIYRLDSNGKSGLRMNISTGDETKARKKALLGTEDPYLSIDDSYRHFVDRSKFMEEWRKRNMLYANNPIGDKPDVNKLAKEIITKPSDITFIEAPKDIKINYSQGLKDYVKNATNVKPSINWNKIGTAIKPYAGSIIDTVGNIATSLINASTLNKMKYTKQPIPQIANKLKTSVNINPQLKTLNESYNQYTDYINNNTASSKVAREALQRARIKNVLDTNTLYATKENAETELINKDRINQQTVANANVDNYNKWVAGKAEFDNAILDKKSENIVGAINNITSSFNTSINNIKKDRQFNNNLISVLAANPNVNPEYLRALGADWVTDKMIEDWKLANKKK